MGKIISKFKSLFFISLTVIILIFLFAPKDFPDSSNFHQALNSVSQDEVLIIFNSGGWGNTPPREAKDFTPIIDGIQNQLILFIK